MDQRRSLIRKSLMYTVASHRDAWIKGIRAYALALDTPSHPARMRGFKVICHFFSPFQNCRIPRGMRGLKVVRIVFEYIHNGRILRGMRGLKEISNVLDNMSTVASCTGCVD